MLFMSRARPDAQPRFRNGSLPPRDISSFVTRAAVEDLRARFESVVHDKPYQPVSLTTPLIVPSPPPVTVPTVVVPRPPMAKPKGTWKVPIASTNAAMNRIATAVFMAGASNEPYWLDLMKTLNLNQSPFTAYGELRDAVAANDFTPFASFPSDAKLTSLADLLEWYFVPLEVYARDVATRMHSTVIDSTKEPFRQRELVRQYVTRPGVPIWAASDARMERTIRVDRLQYTQEIFRQGPVQNSTAIVFGIQKRRKEWERVKRTFIDNYDTYVHDKPSPAELQLMIDTIASNVAQGDDLWENILGLDDLHANPLNTADIERVLRFYEAFSLYQVFLPVYTQAAVTNNGTFDQGLVTRFEADVKNAPLAYYDQTLGTEIVDALRAYLTQLPVAVVPPSPPPPLPVPQAPEDQASVDRYDQIAAKYAFFYNEELEFEKVYGNSAVDPVVKDVHDEFTAARQTLDFTDPSAVAPELDKYEQWIDDRRTQLIDAVDREADTLRTTYGIDSPQWDAERQLPEPAIAQSLAAIFRELNTAFQDRYAGLRLVHDTLLAQRNKLLALEPSLDMQHVDALLSTADAVLRRTTPIFDADLLQVDADLKMTRTLLTDVVERKRAEFAAPPQMLVDEWEAEKALPMTSVPDFSRFYAEFAALAVPPPPPPNAPPSPLLKMSKAAAQRQALLDEYVRLKAIARRFPELPALLPLDSDLEAMEQRLTPATARNAAPKLAMWSQRISERVEAAVRETNDAQLIAQLPTAGPLTAVLMEQLMTELENTQPGRQAIASARTADLAAQAQLVNVSTQGDEQELVARLSALIDDARAELQRVAPTSSALSIPHAPPAHNDYAALHATLTEAIDTANQAAAVAQQQADAAAVVDGMFPNSPGPAMSIAVPPPPVDAQLDAIATATSALNNVLQTLSAEQRNTFNIEHPTLASEITAVETRAVPSTSAEANAMLREIDSLTLALNNAVKRIQLEPLDKCLADQKKFATLARLQQPPVELYQVDLEIDRLFPTQKELATIALIDESKKALGEKINKFETLAKKYEAAEKDAVKFDAILADPSMPNAVRTQIEASTKYQPPTDVNATTELARQAKAMRKSKNTLVEKLDKELAGEKLMYDCFRSVSAYRVLLDAALTPDLAAKADALIARGFDVDVFRRANRAYIAELDELMKKLSAALTLAEARAASYKEFLDELPHFRSLYIYATQPPERAIL